MSVRGHVVSKCEIRSRRRLLDQLVGANAPPGAGSYMLGDVAARHAGVDMWRRTLTAYLVGVLVVLAILNSIAWRRNAPWAHDFAVFSAGFLLGAFGMYLSAYVNGYRRTAFTAMPRRTFTIVAAPALILIGAYSYFLDVLK